MKLLHLDSSVLGDASVSRQLTADIVAREQALHPGIDIVYRDLATAPLGHMSAAFAAATRGPNAGQGEVTPEVAADLAVLEEFLATDIVVIGAPMYNFGIASSLKAWIDRLAVPGKTFRYSEKGPEGLAGAKKVIVASSRGGAYSGASPYAPYEHQESHLAAVFGLLGVKDLTFIRAEGVGMGPEARGAAIAKAEGEIAHLAA